MKGLLIAMIITLVLIPNVLAIESLGTFKQGSCIDLKQTCSNCTYVNLSSVVSPDSSYIINSEQQMTKVGNSYNYTICGSDTIGKYIYCTHGDIDGTDTLVCTDYEVTPSGFNGNLGFYIVMLILFGAFIVLGFSVKEAWFVIIGGMAMIMLGLYSINYGVAGFRDMFMTWGIGLFEIGVGAYLAIKSALEIINENS